MAEDLVLTAISNLKSLFQDEANLFQSVNTERRKLQSNLSAILSVLKDAEKKQLAKKSDALNDWLQKLHDAVYELDDILDDCRTEDIRDDYEGDRSCAFLGFLHPQKVMFRHNIIRKMKAIGERLDFITQEKDGFGLLSEERQSDANPSNLQQWRQSTSFVTDEIIGRDQDKETIVCHLLEASNRDCLYVYPIVGLGGLGKTALAQLVYGDERVTKHFELKKWVCVSENFDLGIVIKAITGFGESSDQLDSLVKKLQDMLQGKKYLIVLDDVWNLNLDKWMQLRSLLACGSRDSAVLVTTRLEKVAMMMRTPSAKPYYLSGLEEDDCWQVFRKRAFGLSVVEETDNLVEIGKEIASKCKGVPLAAKTFGGLLSFETNERSWHLVRDSELWSLPEEEGSIMAALRLSYFNLSPRSRRCFSFCSMFPKDYRISKVNLIHLWMANGLISEGANSNSTLELEDMGEEIVNDLYWRSLIQDISKDDDSGSIRYFKMHDLVHDLAQSISSHEIDVFEEPSATDFSPGTRHISIACHKTDTRKICNRLDKCESLRSLVFLDWNGVIDLVSSHSILKHTRLRALDLLNVLNLQVLPSSIDVLKHLRYLNLSWTPITKLPDSIGSLWNLQTLRLSFCVQLKTFPTSIGRLKNLRHLCNDRCLSLSSMPQSMGELTSLRTLNLVVVGEVERKEFQLSGFEHMKYLKEQLRITHLNRCRDVKDAEKVKLTEKQYLDDLLLHWGGGDAGADMQGQAQILEALRPSPRLRDLSLDGYQGISFSNWMMNEITSFTYIRQFSLHRCVNCTQLPPLWRLPSLKKLELFDLPSMRYLIDSHEGSCGEGRVSFPSLKFLIMEDLPILEYIISGEETEKEMNSNIVVFPCLSALDIENCPRLNSFTSSPLPSLRFLEFADSAAVMLSMFMSSTSYNLYRLNSLRIGGCDSLESFPDEMFEGLNSLEQLYIERCPKLKSFPESIKSLSSLRELRINDCEQLKDISSVFLQLTSLRSLDLSHLLLRSLDTDTLTDLPSLRLLRLNGCRYLESLPNWIAYLPSLEELNIRDCPQLTTIPDSIQQLSKMERLSIAKCPELKRQCEKETGLSWHTIAHIPRIIIDE